MDRMKAINFDGQGGTGGSGGAGEQAGVPQTDDPKKEKKSKPMSRRLSAIISQCSSKMTEILSWQSKVAENKPGLMLA